LKRSAFCFAAIFFAMLFVIGRAPASAAITASLTATTPTYTGTCPVAMNFTGTISGSPGTSFQYGFIHYVSGAQQIVNVGAATLPASGTLPVNDSMNIAATTGANTFDQLWVHNISGAFQPDVYSAKASFSVTCGTLPSPMPNPSGSSAGSRLNKPVVPFLDPDDDAGNPARPLNIITSTDPKVCGAHISNPIVGGLLCVPIAASNKLFIVWTWQPHNCTSCPQDVDGFKIYQTDASASAMTYLSKSSAGPGVTAGVLNVPGGGFLSKCYTVTAYKGAKESHPGYRTCIAAEPKLGTTTVTLQAAHVKSFGWYHDGDKNTYNTNGFLGVTRNFYFSKDLLGNDQSSTGIARGAAMFDLRALVGRPVQTATLHLHIKDGWITANGPHETSVSCGDEIGTGTTAWWIYDDFVQANWLEPISKVGPNIDVVVTGPVRNWLNGAANYGFVLRSSQEDVKSAATEICDATYDPPTLTVEYFK
jgi:hypothetical protein